MMSLINNYEIPCGGKCVLLYCLGVSKKREGREDELFAIEGELLTIFTKSFIIEE